MLTTEFASISLNQNGCDSETIKTYHHLNRPYFNVTDLELDVILKIGESWIFKVPTPQHEDNRTDEHTFTTKVSAEKPMSFLEYFDLTKTLSIS